ncbi:MAG: hypothetical protein R3202_13665 [Candidatus Competibacterales bacterium]|nr:hypothetical protein [Candidatus Competibacterales bacterium]
MAHPSTDAEDFLRSRGIQAPAGTLEKALAAALAELEVLVTRDSLHELTTAEIDVLRTGGFDLEPRAESPLDPLARTAAEYAALLETSLTTREAAERLSVDISRIRQRLTERSLYGFRHDGKWHIPIWQFTDHEPLPNLATVVARLDVDLHPVAVTRWFLTPDPDLTPDAIDRSLSPRDWLQAGFPAEPVALLAGDL